MPRLLFAVGKGGVQKNTPLPALVLGEAFVTRLWIRKPRLYFLSPCFNFPGQAQTFQAPLRADLPKK
ncbi:hypothetical protein COW36_24030 [bacterium (Candidatus Blackallbacteria) CG17_big_fil_post_rev_8_21_14_2_50_48_46]|uniref:Uncharacterized protein n=1 Tax=bacterium (Candidatus Blackallbacteria) CG17_big_fil_post_rev_8_21_14_2_50_48_46 TaxID=2014261 RepID=A0A2M7FWX8_9BACT|nr:MAG: hypothetical protein COW64_18970 [bacterium (Candidatus Blackallbacteria) CG18_big_fil_WC_8_21_14_2_50_49_26]PIW13740.1 MAG: hypothetical protein COW36_24030 [bacterium (Candidatus Blackallbacteria) CG17_big_fil_post_rev_8_21_14_2_50_48_46]PIW44966.1 MAG: hypothetical protein COW20_21660 [bacterium (Candidatus Blackallbacteria) CG13_big_fil_rev_8_21_14_2_50_49_14]